MNLVFNREYNPIDQFFTRAATGAVFMIAALALLFTLIITIIEIIAKIKLFNKCGKQGWKAIIPFYSSYVFIVEICGLHWAWYVGYLAASLFSLANVIVKALKIFVNAMSFYNLATRTNKDKITSMIFGGLFPSITTLVYGFSKLSYDKDIPVSESGVF